MVSRPLRYNRFFPNKNSTMRISKFYVSTLKEAPAEADVASQKLIQALIDEQLVVVQVQVGVDPVFLEEVVADGRLAEQVGLAQRFLLPVAVEQEEQLGLEAGARAVGIEVGQR